ncbi:MAG: Gfo/Idh/MocA family oxidoreductase [Thermoguttaceae bacterium]|nr:Gfo/Idh/MocA family oxidoreductase [Thermoguttaceae bacterium]
MNRRNFHKSAAASALGFGLAALQTETSHARILGANDRIRTGHIGIANRGGQLLTAFEANPTEMEVAGLCDIDALTLEKVHDAHGKKPVAVKDFRDLLSRSDIDAVVLATPDHWHAIQTVEACKAGKDVYVEKPMSTTIHEGRVMVQAARKYERVVQVGTHRRSAPHYVDMMNRHIEEMIGKVTLSRSWRMSNMMPSGIGRCKPCAPPENLDWDLWVGPRPAQEYQENIAPYKFRWWLGYSSQAGNWGVHYFDAMRMLLHEEWPESVCAMGGNFAVDDDRTIPDTMLCVFQFKSGRLMTFTQGEACGNPMCATDANYRQIGEVEFRGTDGTLYISDRGVKVYPERGGQFGEPGPRMKEALEFPGTPLLETERLHALNFLNCIRSRELPTADVEIGHRSTAMCHLANISYAVKQRLEWDSENERFTNCDAANELLSYEYRAPWKLEI